MTCCPSQYRSATSSVILPNTNTGVLHASLTFGERRHRAEGNSEVMLERIPVRLSASTVLRLLFQPPPHQGASTVDSPGSCDRRWTRLRCRSRHGGKLEKPSGRAERHCHNHKLRHRAIRLPHCWRSEELRPVPVD